MPWRPLKHTVHAVCIRQFDAVETDDIALAVGDDVYITEVAGSDHAWCRGWLTPQPSILTSLTNGTSTPLRPQVLSGVFPRECVEIREVLVDDGSAEDGGIGQEHVSLKERDGRSTLSRPTSSHGRKSSSTRNTRSRSIKQSRIFPLLQIEAQLDPVDVLPRKPGAAKDQAPLPGLKIGDSMTYSREEPLVDEISSCLREWHSTRVRDLVLKRDYHLLDKVSSLMLSLDGARKQLVHDLMSDKELADLRETTIWDLVDGNKLIDGAVIVRDPQEKGRTLTAQDNIAEMLKLQTVMGLLSRAPARSIKEASLSHLLVDVKQFPEIQGQPAMLYMYICHQIGDTKPRPVSEAFAVEAPSDTQNSASMPVVQQNRTLFMDLTRAEIGSVSDTSSRIYLVCMLHREEPYRTGVRKRATTPRPSISTQDRFSKVEDESEGRRSLNFFANSRARRRSRSRDTIRPGTADSTRGGRLQKRQASTGRISHDVETRPLTAEKTVRRVVSYGVVDIGAVIRQQDQKSVTMSLWTPGNAYDDEPNDNQLHDVKLQDVLKHLLKSPSSRFVKMSMVGDFHIDLHAFAHSDASLLVREMPTLMQDIHGTRAMNTSASAQQARSDVYLTLHEPIIPQFARCFHPQEGSVPITAETELMNLQLTMEVRTDSGARVESAIWPTSNRAPHTAFRTSAIDRDEAWNQTLRLAIPPDDLPNAHVVLSIADGKNFPFALAWLPLWDDASDRCVEGPQSLAFWDYSEHTASTVNGRGAYQSLPSHILKIDTQQQEFMSSLKVTVTPSITMAPQDRRISALLRWEGASIRSLKPILDGFTLAQDDDIVKFFPQAVSALENIFDILSRNQEVGYGQGPTVNNTNDLIKRALSCLIRTLQVARDRRTNGSEDLFEQYLKTEHTTLSRGTTEPSQSCRAMCRALKAFFGRPSEFEEARELRSLIKVSNSVIKLIAKSYNRPPPRAGADTGDSLESVLAAAAHLMRNPQEALTGTQTMLMQEFASWFPHLALVIDPEELLDVANNMMIASSKKHSALRISRLVMVRQLSLCGVFDSPQIRPQLLAKTKEWLEDYWFAPEDYSNDQLSGLRMCLSVIEAQRLYMTPEVNHYIPKLFDAYYIMQNLSRRRLEPVHQHSTSGKAMTLSLVFPSTYPFPTITTDREDVPNEATLEIIAVLISFFQQGSPSQNASQSIQGYVEGQDLYISKGLQVLRSIQKGDAFPLEWLTFSVTYSKYAVTMLEMFLDLLVVHFVPIEDETGEFDMMSFDTELWEQWFKTLTQLARGKAITVEDSPDQTRRAVWTIGGDIRRTAAELLRRGWLALGWKVSTDYERALAPMDRVGGLQVGMTANLVPSAVDLSMSLHPDLRAVGLDILRSMIVSEWQLNENLDVVQAAFFNTFDKLNRDNRPHTRQFVTIYLEQLRRYFAVLEYSPDAGLYKAVLNMIKDVEQFISALGELSTVHDPASKNVQLVRLMGFLQQTGKYDAYLRRVHELSDLHIQARTYSSAAIALQLHLDYLDNEQLTPKDGRTLEAITLADGHLPAESVISRKNRLYRYMATYYEKGHHWDKVMEMLQLLAIGHQAKWDMYNLASVRTEEARICTMLAAGSLSTPRYFRVECNNDESFPTSFRGKTFIFEGPANCDRKGFTIALKEMFPYVVNLEPDYTPPVAQQHGPAVRMSPVTPFKDHLHPINQQSGVAPSYREQCLNATPSVFAITNRHDVPNVGVTDRLVEKTIYKTTEAFPTILSYSEIVSEEKIALSPIKAAIDRTQRKTLILNSIAELAQTRGDSQTESLIDLLRASVDPATNGSVADYHKLLSNHVPRASEGSTLDINMNMNGDLALDGVDASDKRPDTVMLKSALAVALEDHAYGIESALRSPLIHRAAKKDLRACFEVSFALELHRMYPEGDWRVQSPAWVDTGTEVAPPVADEGVNGDMTSDEEGPVRTRKRSRGRRMSLRKRLSFLSIGGKSIIKDTN